MTIKKIHYESIADDTSRCFSIIINGKDPELMITESVGRDDTNYHDFIEPSSIETVQVNSVITHTLYLALHKIYSSKS